MTSRALLRGRGIGLSWLNSISTPNPCTHLRQHISDHSSPASEATVERPPKPTPKVVLSSVKDSEAAKFASIAETWWDLDGPFKPLHVMNPTRVSFIRSVLCRHFRKDSCTSRPLEGLKIADVGCGGGLLSEVDLIDDFDAVCHYTPSSWEGLKTITYLCEKALARLGATVTGIDAVEKNIKIANFHSAFDPATASIEYCCSTAEQLVESGRKFDAVIALEVIEHVADPSQFCVSLANLTAHKGAMVISTINRSMRAYATAIVAAEYILHWLPKGTHEWTSFLTPEELVLLLQRASLSVKEMAGFSYNPVTGEWSLSDDVSVNFVAFSTKNSSEEECNRSS